MIKPLRCFCSLLFLVALSACSTITPTKARLKIAFASCIAAPEQANWQALADSNPDVLLFLGDNVYFPHAQPISLRDMRESYARLGAQKGFQSLRSSFETYAIWDDHDFGENNSDSRSPVKGPALELFRAFWKIPAPPRHLDESIAYKVVKDFVTLLFTDNRTYRLNAKETDRPAMFGDKQLSWIETELKSPQTPVVIIASGGQLLSKGERHENLAEYPQEQQRLFAAINESPAQVLILSGDRHFAEILQRDFEKNHALELTSSPFAGRLAPSRIPSKHNYRKGLVLGRQNFGILELNYREGSTELVAGIYDSQGRVLLRQYEP